MKSKYKLSILISAIFMICCCFFFLFNMNNISDVINLLNGNLAKQEGASKPIKSTNTKHIDLVNTPELGKYKLNKSVENIPDYSNIKPQNINELCNCIINSKGKINVICEPENLDSDLYIAQLQFLAGGDYDNIVNYFLQNFSEAEKGNAKIYFNVYLASTFKLNVNDFPYSNIQKIMKQYLKDQGYSVQQIEQLISKLKENCD